MIGMTKLVRRFLADNRGATAVEYGLIVSLIVIAMIASLVAVANITNSMWGNVSNAVIGVG